MDMGIGYMILNKIIDLNQFYKIKNKIKNNLVDIHKLFITDTEIIHDGNIVNTSHINIM
jgi:hypothetical protein